MRIGSPAEFADYWDGVRTRTRRLFPVIPADRLEWAATATQWTFGDLIRHLAGIERDMYAENVQGRPARYAGHGRELAEGVEAVLAYHDRKHAESLAIFRGLAPEQLDAKCPTPGGVSITVWKWLRAMVEHEAHHRGQIYLMLGMLGLKTPPLYGLTEEEVAARSRG